MFLVIRIHPLPFLKDPFDHLMRRCLDDSRKNRLSIFDTELLAERYIRKQQILAQQHFMLLTLTSILQDALVARQFQEFFTPLRSMTYFAPRSHHGHAVRYASDYSRIAE